MPKYYCKDNVCAKVKTDEEKKAIGFMNGDCIESSCMRLQILTDKFGDNFDLVVQITYRHTTTLTRLMNKRQKAIFNGKGRYLIHFKCFNRKTRQYIDTSNGDTIIFPEEQEHTSFMRGNNQLYALYHIPLSYIMKYENGEISRFCNRIIVKQNHKIIFSKGQEALMIKRGITIIKEPY